MRKLRFSFEYQNNGSAERRSYLRELTLGIMASIIAGLLVLYLAAGSMPRLVHLPRRSKLRMG
jgi:hypothetical protein